MTDHRDNRDLDPDQYQPRVIPSSEVGLIDQIGELRARRTGEPVSPGLAPSISLQGQTGKEIRDMILSEAQAHAETALDEWNRALDLLKSVDRAARVGQRYEKLGRRLADAVEDIKAAL